MIKPNFTHSSNEVPNSQPKKHGRRYPWMDWFKNAVSTKVKLYRNRDYFCKDNSFMVYTRIAAKNFGFRVKVHVGDGFLEISVKGLTQPRPFPLKVRRKKRNGNQERD